MNSTTLRILCRLSELDLCKKRFKAKREWQEFCCPEHQQKYWQEIRKGKRLIVRKLKEHEERIVKLEKKLGMR